MIVSDHSKALVPQRVVRSAEGRSANAGHLSCRCIDVRFGSFQAVQGVDLTFAAGKVTALIGPNGAGKTTLLNVLSGLQLPTAGTVWLDGQDVTTLSPWKRAQRHMSRSFQIVNVFPNMTVLENIRLAVQRCQLTRLVPWRTVDSFDEINREVELRLREFGLTVRSTMLAGQLSHGEQRGLELALSVIGNPSVLLLDEPLAGVGHSELRRFIDLLREVSRSRTTVLVEHNMDVVMGLADQVVCLAAGSVLASGTVDDIRANAQVRAAYLGDDHG